MGHVLVTGKRMNSHVSNSKLNKLQIPALLILAVVFAVLLALLVPELLAGRLGSIGADNDDQMRLVQVRDLLNGQSWFDLHQYRLGPEWGTVAGTVPETANGTLMHWSRLVDLPLAGLILFFGYFVSPLSAEMLAFIIWPLICSVLVVIGLMYGVSNLVGQHVKETSHRSPESMTFWVLAFCGLLILTQFGRHIRFLPGSVDHHNIQLALLALAIAFAIDPQVKFKSGFLSGIVVALSVAIGVEVYIFAGIICAWFALYWLCAPVHFRQMALGFGTGLAATSTGVFVLTVAPHQYWVVYCDAYSLITFSAVSLGGIGLALSALFTSGQTLAKRAVSLCLVGFICLVMLSFLAPQCFANPLSNLPTFMRELWLDNIAEARSIFAVENQFWFTVGFLFGVPLLALVVSILQMVKRRMVAAHSLLALLLSSAICMTAYQIRFGAVPLMVSVLPLGFWVGTLFLNKTSIPPNGSSLKSLSYILALFVSVPAVWSATGQFVDGQFEVKSASNSSVEKDKPGNQQCLSKDVVDYLNTLPAATILADGDLAPALLSKTNHRALNGNYHRNVGGISAAIRIFTDEENKSRKLLMDLHVDYIIHCKGLANNTRYAQYSSTGLMARLNESRPPSYLLEVQSFAIGSDVQLYEIISK